MTTPDGKGEVLEATGDQVEVKLDNGETKKYPSDDIADDSSAG
ncbi:hypothetical protein [Mucilaginibacter aquaedulcis]|nr:hypothetical protein [Mucilaginibacter aquaedulcis]MDN3551207.1 hypothetical protein [Mucilaginibacter aquaedulcis]